MYTGWIEVGNQEFNVVFDTGSDWLVIESSKCKTCQGPQRYEVSQSRNFKQLGMEVSELYYGSATLAGYKVSDQVCLG
ncbi:MAG: pepsin-like aspartyl protease [bacterium]